MGTLSAPTKQASADRKERLLPGATGPIYPGNVRPSALDAGVYFGRPERTRVVGSLTLCRTAYAPRQQIPEHAHGAAYLCLSVSGSFRERSRRGEQVVVPGSVVFHRPGETHADRFGDEPASCLNVSFAPAWSGPAGDRIAEGGPALYGAPGALGALVWRLVREFGEADDASELSIEGLTLELLAFFVRDARGREERSPPGWMASTIERLRQGERVSLATLANEAGVHASTLARAFRRFQGCSLGEYRRRWRLARACAALRTSDAPLAEIAARSGFADQSHLTRAVRAAVGLTPAAYRNAARAR